MEERKEVMASAIKVSDIAKVGVMAALIYVATWLIHIPIGEKAVLHLGDSMVFTAAIILGKKKAGVASAIGMCLFDVLSPYAIWAPFTFVIKGVMGYLAGWIAYRNDYEGNNSLNNILAFTVAGIWMIVGYYFAGAFIYHSFIIALNDILGNVIQVVGGAVIAIPLARLLKKANVK